jgi:pimeloyl-ACP methyl ester carboxylesterase
MGDKTNVTTSLDTSLADPVAESHGALGVAGVDETIGDARHAGRALPFTETFVEISSGTRAIVVRGPSDDPLPFLLVHGLASNKHMYDGVGQALATAGRRSIAIDQRGHGHSAKPDDGYDIATVSADLVEVLAVLSIPRAIVVGQSWGGNVVIEMGARFPERLAGVVCVDGGFIHLGSQFATWEDCAAKLRPPKLVGTPLATLQGWMREAHPDWPESSRLGEVASFEVRDDQTIAPWLTLDRHMAILHDLYHFDPTTRYSLLSTPTLMVPAGSKAAFASDKQAAVDHALTLLSHGAAHWFHEADHDIHAQFPRELTAVLLEFAKDLS